MRALITGAYGFAGQYLVRHLADITDWEMWGTVRPPIAATVPHGPPAAAPPAAGSLGGVTPYLHRVPVDLCNYASVRAVLEEVRPDYLFHLAAQSIVQRALHDPEATLVNNIVAELNLLRALHELDLSPRTLLVGSSEEYGHVQPSDLPVSEATPFRPENPYAVSKIAQDMLGLQYFIAYSLPVVRVRPFNHIGPGQSEQFVTAAFARQVAAIEAGLQEPVLRVGNLSAERDFTDVRDMVRAYHLALTLGEPGEVYNIGSGQGTSIRMILDLLLGLSTVAVRIERDAARLRPADVPRIVCDARRFQAQTGWHTTISLPQSLQAILDDWRKRVTTVH